MKSPAAGPRTHVVLLAALVAVLAVQPFVARASGFVAELADAAFAALGLFVFLTLCREPWERRTGVVLFIPAAVADLMLYAFPDIDHDVAAATFHGTLAVFLGFAVVVIVRLLARASIVRGDDVLGAVGGYILAALAWSHVYAIAYLFVPNAFGMSPAIAAQVADWRLRRVLFDHLSFTTLTSIGYSDITPVGSPMYALTWTETIFGQFYMAVVVAQLVGQKLAQAVEKAGGDRK
jgi:hypothetical protein